MSLASLLLLGCQLILLAAMQTVTQALGPLLLGRFALAMSVSVYSAQFIQWGMDQLLTVKFARGSTADSRHLFALLLRQKWMAAVVALTLAGIVAMLRTEPGEGTLIWLGACDGACLGFLIPSIFDARGKTATWQGFAFVRHAIYLTTLLVLRAHRPDFFTPLSVVLIHLICILPEIILEQLWIRRNYSGEGHLSEQSKITDPFTRAGSPPYINKNREALVLWRDAAPMALAMLAQQILFNCGPALLTAFDKDGERGGLYLSNQFSIGAASFIAALGSILHARLALHAHEGSAFRARVLHTTFVCAIAGLVVSLSFPIVGAWLVRSFFKNLADVTPTILLFDTWRLAPVLASIPLSSWLICRGHLRAFAICHISAAIIGISIAAAFVSKFGALAAAGGIAAGACSFFVLTLTLVLLDRSETKVEPSA